MLEIFHEIRIDKVFVGATVDQEWLNKLGSAKVKSTENVYLGSRPCAFQVVFESG
jgi:hypothetical protein